MADIPNNNTDKDINETNKEIPGLVNDKNDTISEHTQSEGKQNEKAPKPQIFDYTITKSDDWEKDETIKSNRHAKRANWINIFLFLITLAAFWQTKRSVDISEQAVKDARFNDSIVRYRDSVKSYNDSVSDRAKFILDSTSTATQINALIASQKQFEITNQTFTQIGNAKVDTINSRITFDIITIGKFAIQLGTGKFGVDIRQRIPPENIKNASMPVIKLDLVTILVQGTAHPITLNYEGAFTKEQVIDFKTGKKSLYFGGTVGFKNLSTNRNFTYYFIFEVSAATKFDAELRYANTFHEK